MNYASGRDTSHEPKTAAINRVAPHAYWRTLEASEYDVVRRLQLACMLGAVHASSELWRSALVGDPASSVAIALNMRVPEAITYPVDLRMSVLLNAALGGDAACAVVMSHMLSLMPIERALSRQLSHSWTGRKMLATMSGGTENRMGSSDGMKRGEH